MKNIIEKYTGHHATTQFYILPSVIYIKTKPKRGIAICWLFYGVFFFIPNKTLPIKRKEDDYDLR